MKGYVIVIDTEYGVYVLCTDGMWAWTRCTHSLGGGTPRRFAQRRHAWQWLKSRPLGWWLSLPLGLPSQSGRPGYKTRVLSARTAGVGEG